MLSLLQEAIGMVHLKGYMYKWVMEDLGKKTCGLNQTNVEYVTYKVTRNVERCIVKEEEDLT